MQQTKRRSKKGVILLALTIAMLVLAFVPAALAAEPPAPSQLAPDVTMTGVTAQGNYSWFYSNPDANYLPMMNNVIQPAWTGIVVPALSGGGTLDVGTILYKVDGLPVSVCAARHRRLPDQRRLRRHAGHVGRDRGPSFGPELDQGDPGDRQGARREARRHGHVRH